MFTWATRSRRPGRARCAAARAGCATISRSGGGGTWTPASCRRCCTRAFRGWIVPNTQQYVGAYLSLNNPVTALAYARQTQDAMREYRLWLQTEEGREQQTLNPELAELLNEQEGALVELIRELTA